jgi:transposase
MATRKKFKQSLQERRRRNFSEEFKRKKVSEIEQKTTTIAEVTREYEVSETSVRNWIIKYSINNRRGVRVIVEAESDTRKILEYKARIAELERIIGQKQVLIDFKDKVIELAEEEYGIDIKKKWENKLLSGSGNIGKS